MLQAVDYGEDADLEPEDAAMAEQGGAEAEADVGKAAVAAVEAEAAEAAPASDAALAAVAEPSAAAPVPSEDTTGAAGGTMAAEAAPSGEQATHRPNAQPAVLTATQALTQLAITIWLSLTSAVRGRLLFLQQQTGLLRLLLRAPRVMTPAQPLPQH